ncbi:hypothetical protein COCOR_01113 [Corallococcus coralloides DSM 2259]|uniref:Uncharacterized protein n=1 Tax=Corallococcus coralloides (strain ATCC 25202 / DSM 2259 / NBRC 100086 / M2) TaxID=1144275 RepID=H8MP81_CORCM|nr:hypothetical protein [Corallococcus coralloides]AFE03878.1 hypothetical protein COCOR_01113 [Corallococcus coralloides DSM 2259]
MMTVLGGLLWVLAATPVAKPQGEMDAALKAVKTGDAKTRKDAYATLWKRGMRVSIPRVASEPFALQGPGVLSCPSPLWARLTRRVDDGNGGSTERAVVAFARDRDLLPPAEEVLDLSPDAPAILLRESGWESTRGCDVGGFADPSDKGFERHPAVRKALQACCAGKQDCLGKGWTQDRDCSNQTLDAMNQAREQHRASAANTLTTRLRQCLPAKDKVGPGQDPCALSDSPRCGRYQECLRKVSDDSLARGTGTLDAELALWLEADIGACVARSRQGSACTLIVVDPCQGRVGYRCSDEVIRELQVP